MNDQRLSVRKTPKGFSFYINGSLQFDTADEAIYHETLALPACAIASLRQKGPLKALILGGGDGLLLKRVLGFPSIKKAELVDYDPEVLDLGRTDFNVLNRASLSDPRVSITVGDAFDYVGKAQDIYDLVFADFTYPDHLSLCKLFTTDFFSLIKRRLSHQGIFAMNSVSPSASPYAFWGIYRTLLNLRLHPKPMRVAIPSFASCGYGDGWGFLLSSKHPLTLKEFKTLTFPFQTDYLNRKLIFESMKFPASDVKLGLGLGQVILKPADLFCLLAMPKTKESVIGETINFAGRMSSLGLTGSSGISYDLLVDEVLSEWEGRLSMLIRSIDWDVFFERAQKAFEKLPENLSLELKQLRRKLPELLSEKVFTLERAYQCFSVFLIMMVLINVVYPDNAFAKGGHYYGTHYYHHGFGEMTQWVMITPMAASPFYGKLFDPVGPSDVVPDMLDQPHVTRQANAQSRGGSGTTIPDNQIIYSLSDTLFLTNSGTIHYRIQNSSYSYQVEPDRLILTEDENSQKVFEFYPDEQILVFLSQNIALQKKALLKAMADHQKWLSWAQPAALLIAGIRSEEKQMRNLELIRKALDAAETKYTIRNALHPLPFQAVKIVPGVFLTKKGSVLLRKYGGECVYYPYEGFEKPSEDIQKQVSSDAMDRFGAEVLSKYVRPHVENVYQIGLTLGRRTVATKESSPS